MKKKLLFVLLLVPICVLLLSACKKKEEKVDVLEYIKTMEEVQTKSEFSSLLEEKGYTKEEIDKAIANSKYDWKELAKNYLIEIADTEDEEIYYSKGSLEDEVKNAGFNDEEVKYAFDNANIEIDYNKNALNIAKGYETESKQEIINVLKEGKFTDSEIDYAITNVKFNYNKHALARISFEEFDLYSKSALMDELKNDLFTSSEIDYAIKNYKANYYDRAVDLAKLVHLTVKKSDIKNYLLNKGFTEKEASINLDWIYQVNYGIYYEMSSNKYNFAVGDLLNIGGEKFYVISSNDSETALFAENSLMIDDKYKDDLDYCTQSISPSSEGYEDPGQIKFADKSYWIDSKEKLLSKYGTSYPAYVYDSNSNAYKYVEKYVSLLNNLELFSSIKGKLISYEELVKVGCKENADGFTYCPYFLRHGGEGNAFYLTGSANYKYGVYYIWQEELREASNISATDKQVNSGSVRPLIVVKTSELKNFYTKYKITGTYR